MILSKAELDKLCIRSLVYLYFVYWGNNVWNLAQSGKRGLQLRLNFSIIDST